MRDPFLQSFQWSSWSSSRGSSSGRGERKNSVHVIGASQQQHITTGEGLQTVSSAYSITASDSNQYHIRTVRTYRQSHTRHSLWAFYEPASDKGRNSDRQPHVYWIQIICSASSKYFTQLNFEHVTNTWKIQRKFTIFSVITRSLAYRFGSAELIQKYIYARRCMSYVHLRSSSSRWSRRLWTIIILQEFKYACLCFAQCIHKPHSSNREANTRLVVILTPEGEVRSETTSARTELRYSRLVDPTGLRTSSLTCEVLVTLTRIASLKKKYMRRWMLVQWTRA